MLHKRKEPKMPPALQSSLEQAISAQKFGQLDEAKRLYSSVLKSQPKHPEANHNMGVLASSVGNKEEAKQYFKTALNFKPNVSQFWLSYINILIDLGHLHEAHSVLKKAETLGVKGEVFQSLKAKIKSKNLEISAKDVQLISNLIGKNRLQQVIQYSNELLLDFPHSIFLHMSVGNCSAALGDFGVAIKSFKKLLTIEPKNVPAIHNLGNCYKDLGELDTAISHYKTLLKVDPTFYEAYYNLGNALRESRKLKEAVTCYRKVLKARPNHYLALNNLALAITDLGNLNSAIKTYDKALKIRPDYPEAVMNQSFAYLAQRNFMDGWKRYEHRLNVKSITLTVAEIPIKPKWKPGLSGNVLLWAEQGLGDEVMFASMIPDLYEHADTLIIQIDERLIELFKRSFPSDIVYYASNQSVPEKSYDLHIPIGSLPQYFRTDLNSFLGTSPGYLSSDKIRTSQLRDELLIDGNTYLVGLSWKGGVGLNSDIKSLNLLKIVKALPNKKIKFVNLQYGDTQQECDSLMESTGIQIHNITDIDNRNDIDGLLSLIDACDQVVTISNVTAHLAGAIGKNTSVILPLSYDWRWGIGYLTSYWYSSLKLYQQKKLDNWDHPLLKLRKEFKI